MSLENKIIDFIGPEGAGKTTIAKMLSEKLGLPLVVVGDILRERAKNDLSVIGDECRAMFKDNRYLDPDLLLSIQGDYLKNEKYSKGFVMDGGLRTVKEAEGFLDMLKGADKKMPLIVVYLQVPESVSIERLAGENGRKRNDDTPEGIAKRLSKFNDNLDKRLFAIQQIAPLLRIDATGNVEENFNKVCQELGIEKLT